MGLVLTPYFNDPRYSDQINEKVAEIMNNTEYFAPGLANTLDFRPIRPEEINPSLEISTRTYVTTLSSTAGTFTKILGATTSATVSPTGVIAIFGWIVISDPTGTAPIGASGIVQVYAGSAIKAEISLAVPIAEGKPFMPTLDQIVILKQSSTWYIQAAGAASGTGIIYPMAYRIDRRDLLEVG